MYRERITKSTHPWCEGSLHFGITESDAIVEQEDTVTVHHGVSVRRPPLALKELLLATVEAQLRDQERDHLQLSHGRDATSLPPRIQLDFA